MVARAKAIPRLDYRPFRGSEVLAAGWLTRGRLRSSAYRRIFRDVYVNATRPDTHELRARASALILPYGAAVTGRSAALIWDVKMGDISAPVAVIASKPFGPVAGLSIRTGRLDPSDIVVRKGVPVTSMLRTAWEIARAEPELDAVAWVDALAHLRRIPTGALLAEAGRHLGARGAPKALNTLALCDWRAESPPESHLRVHIRHSGLPQPIPQYRVRHDGYFVARVDFGWPELRFAVEYDGQWHADRAQLADDRDRIKALQRAGWHVHPITNRDLRDVPAMLADLALALKQRSTQQEARSRRPRR
jgi:very-short-patch-repair endonuclease